MKKKLTLWTSLLLFLVGGQEVWGLSRDPLKLFVVHYGDTLSLKEMRQRLRYAEMLQPRVKGDSVFSPVVSGRCPGEYVAYVSDFVALLNRHLQEMPERLKWRVLEMIEKNSVRMNTVTACIRRDGQKNYMSLSPKQAKRLKLEKERNRVIALFSLPAFIPGDSSLTFPDTSIFLNLQYLDANHPSVKALKQAFYELNETYRSMQFPGE